MLALARASLVKNQALLSVFEDRTVKLRTGLFLVDLWPAGFAGKKLEDP